MSRNDRNPGARSAILLLLACAALALVAASPAAAIDPVNQSFLGGIAIEGHDPVAYFRDGRPVRGVADHSFEWQGATWRFASDANRAAFVEAPERYAPQYGGYCAYAVSQGATAGIDPEAWRIVDGKLYLNLNPAIQARWEQDIPGYIAKADENWPKLLED